MTHDSHWTSVCVEIDIQQVIGLDFYAKAKIEGENVKIFFTIKLQITIASLLNSYI